MQLTDLRAQRCGLKQLRARAEAGDRNAADRLAGLLAGWPGCWPGTTTRTGCSPVPSPATGTPPDSWPAF